MIARLTRAGNTPIRLGLALLAGAGALIGLAVGALPEGPAAPRTSDFPNTINDPNISGSATVIGPDEGPLVLPGPPPDIIFVYTGRVRGYVEPCG